MKINLGYAIVQWVLLMKKILKMLFCLAVFFQASLAADGSSVRDVSVEEAFKIINENMSSDYFMVIDVRTPAEYSAGHIAGAVLIDVKNDSFDSLVSKLDKKKKYLVYCLSGKRSAVAADKMKKHFFSDIVVMNQGFIVWVEKGFPVSK